MIKRHVAAGVFDSVAGKAGEATPGCVMHDLCFLLARMQT